MEFILLASLIIASGTYLSRYGDVLAEKWGLSGGWIGLVLLATITSMPELINGVSSVVLVGAPDIAFGDVFGSCVFNLAILAFLDLFGGKRPLLSSVGGGHSVSSGFSIMLIGIASLSVMAGRLVPAMAHVSLVTPLILAVYVMGMRTVFYYERDNAKPVSVLPERYKDVPLSRAKRLFALNALVIVLAATMLPYVADNIARDTGLGRTFVATSLVAATTSLPELVVTASAMRMGALDMAVANILGSNMFDVAILAIDDVVYMDGPVFAAVGREHAITGLFALVMTGVVVSALAVRSPRRSVLGVSPAAIAMIALWLLNLGLLFLMRQ